MAEGRSRKRSVRRADSPSARTSARQRVRAEASRSKSAQADAARAARQELSEARARQRTGLTRRAVTAILLVGILAVSYFYTIRGYVLHQRQIAVVKKQIAEHEEAILTLEEELARWQDDEFVRMQARERLGWVVPGETGFRVIGADGKPYAGGQQIGPDEPSDAENDPTWWSRMWGSVQTADDPLAGDDAPLDNRPVQPIEPTAPVEQESTEPDDGETP